MTRYPFDAFVGFDRLFNEIDNFNAREKTYPPHNLIKKDLDGGEYAIEVAVAGFAEEDLDVEVKENLLIVSGELPKEEYTYLHKGISTRKFKKEFRLADNMKVIGGELKNGLLVIDLMEDIPEEKKPVKIDIGKKSKKSFLKGA